jgi:outer membrane protein OmpA-like peptidoglycan-associated protein/tetratricopeptide (TPR) repeat protein
MLCRHSIKNLLVSFCAATMSLSGAYAQNGRGLFNQAENLFKNKKYYEASQVFEKYLATERNSRPRSTAFAIEKKVKGKANLDPHQEAVYQLATSYRMINDYQKAEKYYKEAIGFSEKAYPAARYWYAVTLRANKNYPEATLQITAFLEKHTQMDELLIGADRELENLKFIQMQSERVNDQFVLNEIKGKDPLSGYAIAQRDGGYVFTAITEETEKDGQKWYLNTLFESMNPENPLEGSDAMDIASETGVHDGMATFTRDGKTMFFTRWTKNNNQTNSAIYISRWKNKNWTKPVKAPEPLNLAGCSSGQPSLTSDDRYLLFSSDRAGGTGGFDLWVSSLDSLQECIQVRNLGSVINTTGDEEAPYLHDKSRTLVFSSNGRVGMGGFDIYSARGNFNLNTWEKPVNAGAPLNSSKDDMYYISTDEENIWNTGWVSSDRSSECCLALFSVKENNAQYVYGTVVDCETRKPLPNVLLSVTDLRHPDRQLGKYKADTAGRYAFELHNSAHFKISAVLPEYEAASANVNLEHLQGRDSIANEPICLKTIQYPEKEIEKLLMALERSSHVGNFAYKKAILSDSAYDNLDSLAKILKKFPNMLVEVDGYTDGIGGTAYNLKLAQKRVDACIRYLTRIGVSRYQISGKAMGKCCPIAPEMINGKDNPVGREVNRRVEYKVLKH